MAYFDNAATTFPKPEEVYSFSDKFYREYGVNVGRGQYRQADTASSLVTETRNLVLDMFHAPNKQVVFTHSATESLNVILHSINFFEGMNIYITPFEHNAVTRVLHHYQSIFNLNIIELNFNLNEFRYDIENITYQFQEQKPSLVIVSHASNVCGVIAPIKEIFQLAKQYNSTTVADMSQTAGLVDIDLKEVQSDFSVFAGHKTMYSYLGVGGFVCEKNVKMQPFMYGGTGVDSANADMPSSLPERFEVGSLNINAISSLNASLKWIKKVTHEKISLQEKENCKKLIDVLSDFNNIQIIGNQDNTVGVVSCLFSGYSPDEIGKVLTEHDVSVRVGLHCSPTAHKFLGTFPAGTVRFSVSYFTSDEDFKQLKEALDYIEMNG